jgi:hypothetical protein
MDEEECARHERESAPAITGDFHGLWRKGNELVVTRDAVFPPRCVKTNLPTTNTRNVTIFFEDRISMPFPWAGVVLLVVPFLILLNGARSPSGWVVIELCVYFASIGGVLVYLMRVPLKIGLHESVLKAFERKSLLRCTRYIGCGILAPVAFIFLDDGVTRPHGILGLLRLAHVWLPSFFLLMLLNVRNGVRQPGGLVRVLRTDETYAYLGGVSPQFLAALPDFIETK